MKTTFRKLALATISVAFSISASFSLLEVDATMFSYTNEVTYIANDCSVATKSVEKEATVLPSAFHGCVTYGNPEWLSKTREQLIHPDIVRAVQDLKPYA